MAKQQKPEKTEIPEFAYTIVGLQKSDYMPILHRGKSYNLASLSQEEAELLAAETPYITVL